jgi:methanogenic corrinoid protein MtbC1
MPDEARASGARIGELGRRVGVSEHLLRVWERRYGVLKPVRTPGGQRLYSAADEDRVRRMQAYLAAGLAPAQAAGAALDEEGALGPAAERRPGPGAERAPRGSPGPAGGPGADPAAGPDAQAAIASPPGGRAGAATALAACLVSFDEPGAQSMLDGLFARYTVEAVLRDVVMPCLRGIGERWAAGTVTIGAEHFASNLLRGRLAALAQGWGRGIGPRAVLACAPGEQHDLPLFILGIVLHRNGWRVEYLGADTPVADVAAAVTATGADLAVITSMVPAPLDRAAASLAGLAAAVPLALGGPGATRAAADAAGARLLDGDPVTAAETMPAPARSANARSRSSPGEQEGAPGAQQDQRDAAQAGQGEPDRGDRQPAGLAPLAPQQRGQ